MDILLPYGFGDGLPIFLFLENFTDAGNDGAEVPGFEIFFKETLASANHGLDLSIIDELLNPDFSHRILAVFEVVDVKIGNIYRFR